MKKLSFILMVVFTGFCLSSCEQETIRASGEVRVIDSDITGFSELDVSDDFDVYVNFSSTEESIRLEVDENIANRVVIEKSGNTLVIRLEGSVNLRGNVKLEAYISTAFLSDIRGRGDVEIFFENTLSNPDLNIKLSGDSELEGALDVSVLSIELDGDSKMDLSGTFDAKQVALDLAGDSDFEGGFNTENLTVDLRGDSKVLLQGSAISADMDARGDSDIEDFSFSVGQLVIRLSGDSNARLTVTESLDVDAGGDSEMRYRGGAVVSNQRLTGDSKLIKED